MDLSKCLLIPGSIKIDDDLPFTGVGAMDLCPLGHTRQAQEGLHRSGARKVDRLVKWHARSANG